MRAGRECFSHTFPTARAVLARVMWGNCYHDYPMHRCIVFHPAQESSPGGIVNTLGKHVVLDHVADLKLFIGNQVVRRDKRVCLFAGKILALPLHFQRRFRQSLAGFLPVLAPLFRAGKVPMQPLQLLFRFPIMTWVLNGLSVGVGIENLECLPSGSNFQPVCLYSTERVSC